MKKQILIIWIIIIVIFVGFSGCVNPDQGFVFEKVVETPDNFINISYNRFCRFIIFKNAILNYTEQEYILYHYKIPTK